MQHSDQSHPGSYSQGELVAAVTDEVAVITSTSTNSGYLLAPANALAIPRSQRARDRDRGSIVIASLRASFQRLNALQVLVHFARPRNAQRQQTGAAEVPRA